MQEDAKQNHKRLKTGDSFSKGFPSKDGNKTWSTKAEDMTKKAKADLTSFVKRELPNVSRKRARI